MTRMVEWKKLGDCIKSLKTGLNPRKNFVLNSDGSNNYYITVRELDYWRICPTNKTDKVDDNAIKIINNRSNLEVGDVLFSGTGTIGRTALISEPPINWNIKEGVYTIKPKNDILNSRFLIELLHSNILINKINENTVGDPIRSIPMKNLVQIEIPLPSISEQTRIVGILDTFTASIDNLKEQIAQRRKQYEYYRDQLLDLEGKEGVEIKSLGVLCELVTKQTGFDYSSRIKPALLTKKEDNSIPFLQTKNFSGRYFDYNTDYHVPNHIVQQFPKIVLDKPCLLFSIVGASIGNVGLFPGDIKCFLGGAISVLKFKNIVNIHYVYEIMSSWYGQKLIKSKIKGGGQNTITVEDIRRFTIPVPSISEQQRIVEILDSFEASIQNLETQLSQREKQYEYYRNKLLTFE